ncbi:MAG: DnaA regulatory inactivator Hda [Gammaproteobacteria bacterium]|nr:DnaA regulatory inactivator Hda [Gammaproteobacteria bacterium]
MQSLATQLPLQLNLKEVYRFDNFYFSQPELKGALTELSRSIDTSFVYLWGEQCVGKSHLLMATAENAGKDTFYLPLTDLVQSASPDVLESVENVDLLCIDDLDAVAGQPEWEEALFHCFNRLQHSGCKLLISAAHSPATVELTLPDLRSRMGTALIYQLDSLEDNEKQQALILQAQTRGLELPEEVANYVLRHHSRDMDVLMTLLQSLDKASMIEKRRLTIPFVRQILNG